MPAPIWSLVFALYDKSGRPMAALLPVRRARSQRRRFLQEEPATQHSARDIRLRLRRVQALSRVPCNCCQHKVSNRSASLPTRPGQAAVGGQGSVSKSTSRPCRPHRRLVPFLHRTLSRSLQSGAIPQARRASFRAIQSSRRNVSTAKKSWWWQSPSVSRLSARTGS